MVVPRVRMRVMTKASKDAVLRRGWKRYGISMTLENYLTLLERQGGVCAICKKPPGRKRLAVDHDHVSKKTRGLLCVACNNGLGIYEKNIERFRRYLGGLEI